MLFISVNSFAQTIDVCSSCQVKTIKKAIEIAKTDDIILLKKGTYKESDLIIDKRISLKGEKGAMIDGEFDKLKTILTIMHDSVNISNITFLNVGISYIHDNAAIRVKKSNSVNLTDNIFKNVFFGVIFEKSDRGQIINNDISSLAEDEFSSGNGIHMWKCSDMVIRKNKIYNMRDGIYLEFVKNSSILDNHSLNNIRYGLHFMFSDNDVYFNNIFEKNGAGVAVMFSKEITVKDNLFIDNWGGASYGLLLKEINDIKIIGNTFKRNTIGINSEGTNRNVFMNNNFISNGWAIRIRGACYANIIKNNNFINNTFDLSFFGRLNDNIFIRNYWSDYSGYDLNKDGIGDVPYRPVKLFSYIVNKIPESIVLLRSLFIDIINFSEKVTPIFTPDDLLDLEPLMNEIE